MIARYGDPTRWKGFHFATTRRQSVEINELKEPHVVISASGMVTGGRVLHHLARRLPDPRCAVVFVGFQAPGTRGQLIQGGRPSIKIHGQEVEVRCRVRTLDQFSDHADYEEILGWLAHFHRPPRRTFLVHGEPAAAETLRERIARRYGWELHVAQYLETVKLGLGPGVPSCRASIGPGTSCCLSSPSSFSSGRLSRPAQNPAGASWQVRGCLCQHR